MKKILLIVGVGIVLTLSCSFYIVTDGYVRPQLKYQVLQFIKSPNNKQVEATQKVRRDLKKLKNPKVNDISDPEGGTKNTDIFAFGINGKTYSAVMEQVGTFSWKLKELY